MSTLISSNCNMCPFGSLLETSPRNNVYTEVSAHFIMAYKQQEAVTFVITDKGEGEILARVWTLSDYV